MRRAATVLASLAMAGASLLLPGSAQAANGTLIVNTVRLTNPHGCYNASPQPVSVRNHTGSVATVYSATDCRGDVLGVVVSGGYTVFGQGSSVSIA